MRILVAAERLGPAGGMERYLDTVLPAFVARGARVHAVVRSLAAAPEAVAAEPIAWSDERDEPSPQARRAVERRIAAFAPDVAIAHNVLDAGIVEALRAAPRFAYHVHDHRPFCPNGDRVYPRSGRTCTAPLGRACLLHAALDGCAYGPRPRTAALVRRRERLRDAVDAADVVVTASRYVTERAAASGIARARLVEIPVPLADDAYAEPALASARGGVVFAGRMVPQKGLLSLVRALGGISAARRPRLTALGDGPERVAARAEAARRGVALDAPGSAGPGELRAAIDAASAVVLPSLWAEPFGTIGIEAFARGRTVVAYDSGGVRAWLHDGDDGIAVAAGDERALGEAIVRIVEDGALRARLESRARAAAEAFRCGPLVDATLAAILR